MDMKVKLPGIGSAFNNRFKNSSVLIDDTILLDCGANVPAQLPNNGRNLEVVVITHLHGDHVYGLERLGFMGYFVHKKRPGLTIALELKETLSSLLCCTMAKLQGPNGGAITASRLETFFDLSPVLGTDWMQWRVGGKIYWTRLLPVNHVVGADAFAFQITDLETSLLYTGDTRESILPLLARLSSAAMEKYFSGQLELDPVDPDRGVWYPEDLSRINIARKLIIHDVSKHNMGPAGVHCPAEVLIQSLEIYQPKDWMRDVEIVATHLDWDPDVEDPLKGSGIRIPEEMVEL